jgi:hypothetical protein
LSARRQVPPQPGDYLPSIEPDRCPIYL